MIILLDTNFLLLPNKHSIDIFSEIERIVLEDHELIVPSGVVRELEAIAGDSGKKDSVSARVALQLIEQKNLKVIKSEGNVDDFIKKFVDENRNVIVCTNDKDLKRAVKGKAGIIYMRSRDHLERV